MPEDDYLVFKNIRKTFPGVVALEDISLSVRKGEIHAMLGENGAGKTTLMNILYGLHHADSGEIYFNGERLEDNSPRKAIRRGIGMIHQHFMLIPVFTVLENIALGQPSQRPPLLELEQLSRDVLGVAEKFNIKVDLNALIEDLTVGSQQKVEILKALYKGAELLILDEPTSVLTPQEIQDLFRLLYELRDGGCTIIFISHKLNEVMQISDRITVLRDGKVIQTVDKGQTNPNELSRLMVGREVATTLERNPCCVGEACLALEHIVLQDKVGRGILKDISLGVCSGEIVGVAGVDDNGQTELAEVIAGLRLPSAGSIHMFGEEVTHATTRQRIEKGLSFIPADRRNQGLVVDSSIAENFILEIYYRQPFTRGITLNRTAIREYAQRLIHEYDVRTPSSNVPAKNLSGGNQQKVIVGREIAKTPKFLLVMQPTWGLDVGAIEYVHRKLMEEKEKGLAILLISTDLEEIRKLSDRFVILYGGEIVGYADSTTPVEEVGLMMVGSKRMVSPQSDPKEVTLGTTE